jgi:hypothetical protein
LATSAFFCAAVLTATSLPAGAWGFLGHTLISRAGASGLGPALPAFVRDAAAVDEIAALGPELDRSRDAGETHDRDLDPGHYADVGDDGTIYGVDLSALPPTREAYDTALRAAGSDEYRAGFLPYALIDGWQQIAKDFAIWRIDDAGARRAPGSADRAWFAADRALRQVLTLRDIGVWSHYVGDASQPLHVTVHFNGWGAYPNPNGYSVSHTVHADFESRFVDAHATLAAVTARMRPPASSGAPIAAQIGAYLRATEANVGPLYELEKRGDFASGSAAAVNFTNARLADGAAELRDLITLAWVDSANVKVGYPHAVTPAEVDLGQIPFDKLRLTAGGD